MDFAFPGTVLSIVLPEYVIATKLPIGTFNERFLLQHPDGAVINDGEKEIQWLIENCDHKLRMYGSARELANNLKIYRNFPSCRKFFNVFILDSYSNTVEWYKNLKGEMFLLKQGHINLIYEKIYEEFAALMTHEFPSSMVNLIFNSYADRLDDCCDFVKFDQVIISVGRFFYNHVETLLDKVAHDKETEKLYSLPLQTKNFEDTFSCFKKLIPKWDDKKYLPMKVFLELHFKQPHNWTVLIEGYIFAKVIADSLKETFKAHPEAFLPRSEISSPVFSISAPLYEDGTDRFLVKATIIEKLKIQKSGKEPYGILETMNLDDAYKAFGKRLDQIELIKYPIVRTKHAAVPILTPNKGHCILAADALIQFLRSLIFEQKVFQNVSAERWLFIQKSLYDTPFTSKNKFRFLLTVECFEKVMNNKFNQLTGGPRTAIKDVRNAKKDGFTEQNLKNELTNLGLTVSFPEILNYAEGAYKEVVKNKKEFYLRTCDLFDAVENCVMISVFEKLPELKIFLHYQKACHRIANLKCEYCLTKLEPHISNGTVNQKSGQQPTRNNNNTTNDNKVKQQPIEKHSVETSKKPDDSDSGCCQTCILEKTRNKLEINEKKLKELEKELSNSQNTKMKIINENIKCIENMKLLTEANDQLTKKVTNLESQLKDETQKIQLVEKEVKQKLNRANEVMKNALEKENSEKNRVLNESLEKIRRLETQLGNKNKEVEGLRQELNKKIQEVKNLKANFKEEIEKKTRRVEELTESCNQLSMRTGQLESLLEIEKQQNRVLLDAQQSRQSSENKKDKQIINELREMNLQLTGQNDAKDSIIKSFFDRIGPSQKSFACSSTQTEEEDKRHGGARYTLLGLWKIKDSFTSGIPLKLAKEVIEKMRNGSDESGKVHKMANYELNNYEGQIRTYLQSVEVNIEKIKKTGECHDLLPLSNYPSLSHRFIHQYWDLMNQEKKKKNDDSITDSECLFCYFEMKSNEQTLECEHCRKITHLECASKWLRINRSCPNCRREQLDPTEFPPLS